MLPLTKRTLNDGGDTVLVSIHQCEFNSKSYGCSFIAAPKNMKRFNLRVRVEERRPKYYYDSEDDSGNDDKANNSRISYQAKDGCDCVERLANATKKYDHDGTVTCTSVNCGDKLVLVGNSRGWMSCFYNRTPAAFVKLHDDLIVNVSRLGELAATCSLDRTLKVWKIKKDARRNKFELQQIGQYYLSTSLTSIQLVSEATKTDNTRASFHVVCGDVSGSVFTVNCGTVQLSSPPPPWTSSVQV